MLTALYLYLTAVLADGDYANDWLTHLPRCLRHAVRAYGRQLARALEGAAPSVLAYATRAVGGLRHCADPTLPARYTDAMLPVWHVLTRLYDLLLTVGAC